MSGEESAKLLSGEFNNLDREIAIESTSIEVEM